MKDTMIGVDLAKNVFQLHAASMTGQLRFSRKLSREKFRSFMAGQPPAVVVMEACGRQLLTGLEKGLRVGRVDDSPYPWHHPRFMS